MTAASLLLIGVAPSPAHADYGPANRLLFTWDDGRATAGVPVTVTVQAWGTAGAELAWLFNDEVHFSSSDPKAILPANYKFGSDCYFPTILQDCGEHSFTVTFKTSGRQTLTVTDVTHPTVKAGTDTFEVSPASTTTLSASGLTSTYTKGAPAAFKVTLKDAYGNLATGYRGTVHFTNSDGGATPLPNYTFTEGDAGAHWFAVTFNTAGFQTIVVNDTVNGALIATTSTTVGAAPYLEFEFQGAQVYAGYPVGGHLYAWNAGGGTIFTGYRGTVRFTSSDPKAALPADYTFSATYGGADPIVLADLVLKTAGTQTVTATDTANGSIVGTATFTVLGGDTVAIQAYGLGTVVDAGAVRQVRVYLGDPYGNLSQSIKTVHFSSSDPKAVLPADFTYHAVDAGQHAFNVTLKTAGPQSVRVEVKSNTKINSTQTASVLPGPMTGFAVGGLASPRAAGAPGAVTVRAVDAYGNTTPTYSGTVHLSSSDPAAVLAAAYAFNPGTDAGAHGFAVTLRTAGVRSVTATDKASASLTGSQSGIQVVPAAAVGLSVSGIASPRSAGSSGSPSVLARDAYGNTATGYRGKVHFTSSDPAASLPADYAFTATDGGVHLFTAGVTLKTGGTWEVRARDTVTSTITGAQAGIVVTAVKPSAPTGVTVVPTLATAKVTWVAPTFNGGSAITAYTATATPGGKSCATTGAVTLTCTITGMADGPTTVSVTAKNSAGTGAPSTASAAFRIDGLKTTAAIKAPATPTKATTLSYALAFNESVTGLAAADFTRTGTATGCVVGTPTGSGAAWAVPVTSCSAGTVILALKALSVLDLAANAGPAAAVTAATVTIDRTAPTATLKAPATPTKATTLSYALAFNESVTGLAAADFTRTGTATGCVVGTPTGSGAAWAVPVTSCSAGTVILALKAASVTDAAANAGPAAAVTAATVTIDRTVPTATAPVVSLRTGASLSGSVIPVTVAWTGADTGGAGIARYELVRSTNSGTWSAPLSVTTASSATTVTGSGTVRFMVRAIDRAGNTGAWSAAGPNLSPAIVQLTAGTWATQTASVFSGGSTRYASTANASATYTLTGRSVAFVTTVATSRGAVRIYVDNTLVTTLDTYAATTAYQRLAWAKTWSASGSHTVKLVIVGTAGRPRVDLDAFAIIK